MTTPQEKKPSQDPLPKAPMGPALTEMAKLVPGVMSELTQQFMDLKSLGDRALIRLRMKALLDLFAADTGYPNVPAISTEQKMKAQGNYFQGGMGGVFSPSPVLTVPALQGMGLNGSSEVEQLQQELKNAVAEDGPSEIAPAPGAPVAVGQA